MEKLRFKKGEYIISREFSFLKDLCKEGVIDWSKISTDLLLENTEDIYVCVTPSWEYNRELRFNKLTLISLTNGHTSSYMSKTIENHDFCKIPEKYVEKLNKRVKQNMGDIVEKDAPIIDKVKESLEVLFPGNWDLVISKENFRVPYEVIIRFPSITITNGKGNSHEIKDLYVKWGFGPNFIIKEGLRGMRASVTYMEYFSKYLHSHLNAVDLEHAAQSWPTFCLGTGDFANLNAEWGTPDRKFVQEEFELLLYQLDAYVRWESLGGGPYIRISSISVTGNRRRYLGTSEIEDNFTRIVKRVLLGENLGFPLKFNNVTRKFDIDYLELEDYISRTAESKNVNLTKVKKTPSGEYLYGDLTFEIIKGWVTEGNYSLSGSKLIFREKEVPIRIIPIKEEVGNTVERTVVHPDVIKHTQRELIARTNYYFIKTYGK